MRLVKWQREKDRAALKATRWGLNILDVSEDTDDAKEPDTLLDFRLPPWWRDTAFLVISMMGAILLMLLDAGFPIRERLG